MEMLVLVGLCIITYAIIGRQHSAMRRVKARIKDNEQRRP